MSNSPVIVQWKAAAPYLLSLLRIFTGLILAVSGTIILFGFPAAPPGPGGPMPSQMVVGGWLEFIGGLLLMVGFLTRPVAFLLSGMMAVAFFQFHFKGEWPAGIVPNLNNGIPAAVLCFVYLFYSSAGAGRWSIDSARDKGES